ncbi:phosphotransferase family protein [Microbacterium sp.]|uniref:phosphotransferase family protein n=1 Tax=Microbacterium sp. TaxID=51671 RepID=UPI003A89FC0A
MSADAVRALVRRDAALPALAALLSRDRLSELLGGEVVPRRLRYKPGSSIVVAVDLDGGRRWVAQFGDHAKARKSMQRAARAGWQVTETEMAGVVTGPALADRRLVRIVRRLQHRHPEVLAGASVVRHNPHRRLVLRSPDADGDRFVKVGSPEMPEAVRRALHDARVPALVPVHLTGHVGSTPWWGCGDLTVAGATDAVEAAAGALAALHDVRRPAAADDARGELDAAVRGIATIAPVAARPAQRIAAGLRLAGGQAQLHGDFSADQVLVGDDGIRLVDFDRARIGPAERDLGSFAADARVRGDGGIEAALWCGYTGAAIDERALAHWTAFGLLTRALEPFRTLQPDWPAAVERIVGLAAEASR